MRNKGHDASGSQTVQRSTERVRSFAKMAALAVVLGAAISGVALPSADAQVQSASPSAPLPGRAAAQHGAWSVICDTPPGAAGEQCGAMQRVVSAERPDLGLTVIVFETADKSARVLRVLAPLNIFLPNGLGLTIDGSDQGRAVFVRCLREGCQAEVVLSDELVSQLQRGREATFVIFQSPEEGTGFPVDLRGFTDAFAQVTG